MGEGAWVAHLNGAPFYPVWIGGGSGMMVPFAGVWITEDGVHFAPTRALSVLALSFDGFESIGTDAWNKEQITLDTLIDQGLATVAPVLNTPWSTPPAPLNLRATPHVSVTTPNVSRKSFVFAT